MTEGEQLPRLTRHLGAPQLVIYGAATWDFHRLHYAPEDGSAPIVDGQYFGGLLAKQALDWGGPRSRVLRMSFRFAAPVFAGETVTCEGTVASMRAGADGESIVEISQTISCGDRIAVRDATVELSVPT